MKRELLDLLRGSDCTGIAGEAKSHCVLETLEDLAEEFAGEPEILDRIYLLEDCTSPILHADVDYEARTSRRLAVLTEAGIHVTRSTDPLPL